MATTTSGKARLPKSLKTAGQEFVTNRSPQILLSCLAIAVVMRLVVGDYGWSNLIPIVVVIALEPFLEWALHIYVLHAKPISIRGRQYDTIVASDHRAHHADPRDLPLLFIPFRWCLYLVAAVVVIGLLIPDWSNRATWYVAAFAMAVTYEWIHFLIHTDYKPKRAPYRHLYNHHRLHHFRNEQYWFGITNTLGDEVLRTAPDKKDVPVSPTAKNLHGGVGAGHSAGSSRGNRVQR